MKPIVQTPWYESYDGVRPHLEYPDCSAYKLLEASAKKYPRYIAYEYFKHKVKYKKFIKQIDIAARAFKALGVNYKDIVCICMPNTPEGIIAFYALNKIGAVATMIHPLSSESEIKSFVELTNSKFIVAIDLVADKAKNVVESTNLQGVIYVSAGNSMSVSNKTGYNLTKGLMVSVHKNEYVMLTWKEFMKIGKKYKKSYRSSFGGDDVAAILYSGGSTGTPKGIELTNTNFNVCAIGVKEVMVVFEPGDSILCIMPIFHGFGLGVSVHAVLAGGGKLILVPQFSAKTFDKLITKHKPNAIVGVPTLFEALISNPNMQKVDLSYLKMVISGGDSLSLSLKEKVDQFLRDHGAKVQVREGYGLTEALSACCVTPAFTYRPGSIGLPFPDTYIKIVKPDTQKELKYGEIGEIVVSGPLVMKGYINNPKETNNTLRRHKDGLLWLHTGDMGFMDPDGYVYFKQRLKRLIMSSGYCVYPQYIENVVESLPEVLYSCAIGIPHPYKQEVAKVFIVLKDKKKQTDETMEKIRKHCEKELAKYSWPYEYEFRDSLPKTLVGKVAYRKLMEEEEEKRKPGYRTK